MPLDALTGRSFDAVLFDMDGTLVDSVAVVDRAWRQWAIEYGLPDAERFTPQHGKPARLALAQLVPPADVEPSFARLLALEVAASTAVRALPGAVAALTALADAPHAICTSSTTDLAEIRIKAARLPVPPAVVTADDTARGKPAPDPYLEGSRRLGVSPERCLVVEDAPVGIEAARAAGCAALAVTGTHSAEVLASARPEGVAEGIVAVRFATSPDGIRVEAA